MLSSAAGIIKTSGSRSSSGISLASRSSTCAWDLLRGIGDQMVVMAELKTVSM